MSRKYGSIQRLQLFVSLLRQPVIEPKPLRDVDHVAGVSCHFVLVALECLEHHVVGTVA